MLKEPDVDLAHPAVRESRVVVDNWVLQEVAELLVGRLGRPTVGGWTVDVARNAVASVDYEHLAIQVSCLLNLLTDIVLQDRLVCEQKYADTWRIEGSLRFLEPEVLDVIALDTASHHRELMESLLSRMCPCSALSKRREESEKAWASSRTQSDPEYRALIWGTAGNLARSHVANSAYCPHPLRAAVLRDVNIARSTVSGAPDRFGVWLHGSREKLARANGTTRGGASFGVVLPAVAARVLERAGSIDEIVPAALEVRRELAPLRNWLGRLQYAVEEGVLERIATLQQELDDVAQDMITGQRRGPRIELAMRPISLLFFSIALPGPKRAGINLPVGVHGLIKRLALENTGERGVRQLLAQLGESPARVDVTMRALTTSGWQI